MRTTQKDVDDSKILVFMLYHALIVCDGAAHCGFQRRAGKHPETLRSVFDNVSLNRRFHSVLDQPDGEQARLKIHDAESCLEAVLKCEVD